MKKFPHRWRDRAARLYREVHTFGPRKTFKLRRGYRRLVRDYPFVTFVKTSEYLLAEAAIWRSIGDLKMAKMFEDLAHHPA